MNIFWYGESYFRVSVQKEKSETVEVVIEPFGKDIGLKRPKIKADILIEKEGVKYDNVDGKPFIISNPGEYEIGGVFIQKTSYAPSRSFTFIEAEEIRVCHLGGDFDDKDIASEYIETISEADILMVPVGGQGSLDHKGAAAIIAQTEPKMVIPMNYGLIGSKVKRDDIKDFLKVMGVDKKEELPKLNIKERDLAGREGIEIVELNSKA